MPARESLRAPIGASDLLEPCSRHGAQAAIKNVLGISTVKKNVRIALCAYQCEGLVRRTAVVEHECHVGNR